MELHHLVNNINKFSYLTKFAYPIKVDRKSFDDFCADSAGKIIGVVFQTLNVYGMDEIIELAKFLGPTAIINRLHANLALRGYTNKLKVKKIIGAVNRKTYYSDEEWNVTFLFNFGADKYQGLTDKENKRIIMYIPIIQMLSISPNDIALEDAVINRVQEILRHELTHAAQYGEFDFKGLEEKLKNKEKLDRKDKKTLHQMDVMRALHDSGGYNEEALRQYHNLSYEKEAFHSQVEEELYSIVSSGFIYSIIQNMFSENNVSMSEFVNRLVKQSKTLKEVSKSYHIKFMKQILKTIYKFLEDKGNDLVIHLNKIYIANKDLFEKDFGEEFVERLNRMQNDIKSNKPGLLNDLLA